MTGADLLPATVLKRKAVVYVRQSTQTQVQTNLESQRRQYDLVDEARRRGFRDVEVIDDDLGRSASGTMARPGFDRLVAWLCAGDVGAVLCFDASRLARNGRDWHHLLELCGLVGARVIDTDGIYDPCRPNDRLLLGMKGSISEFELGVIRSRMHDAKHGKALRGDLRCRDPEQTWGCSRPFVTMSGQAEYLVNNGGHSHAIRCLGGNDDCRPVCRSAACGGG
jgi:DNA invertase Pin-like site-specific DNA recombinase